MTPEHVFSIANSVALIAWLLLAVMPRLHWVSLLASRIVPATFAATYVLILAAKWGTSSGNFSSLAGVASLFANPWVLLVGWLHYLAFDLLVGHWEVHDARQRGIPHLLVVPCLALTFLFGPAGWLLYNVVRLSRSRAFALNS
jgi:ABA4-like protein